MVFLISITDVSRSFNAPNSWNSETSNEPTTVGANEVTETTVRRLTVLLEKRALSNQEARTKFPDQPKRFMQSKLELQETLEEMQILERVLHLLKMRSISVNSVLLTVQ
ncbi:hypothetical protein EWB00_009712, partial [Schistosoma japonicum]